jgi:poly-gamma-glutamate synthesis protein (capsule biosynthesis protein)
MIVPDAALEKTLWRNRSLYTLLPFDRLTPRYRILYVDGGNLLDTDLTAYPLAFASDRPNYNRGKLTRILLSGVTALTRLTTQAIDAHSIEWAGEAIKPYANRADFFHTSNEVSFTPDCPKKNALTIGEFCSKEAHFGLLPYIGVNVVELTGNHNNDFGTDAYLQTLAYYHRQNISTIGGGANLNDAQKPLLLDHHGNKIAWVACNWAGPQYALATKTQPGAAYCDWNWLKATLPALSKDNDLLLVTVQYKEYEQYQPTPEQERDFRALADLGADVVIGTQAHKPQTFAFYQTTSGQPAFIHYGLGNLFFDQPFWGNSRFFMDQLYIYEGRLLNVDLFTGIIDDNARPRPMNAEERQNFLVFMFNTQGAN